MNMMMMQNAKQLKRNHMQDVVECREMGEMQRFLSELTMINFIKKKKQSLIIHCLLNQLLRVHTQRINGRKIEKKSWILSCLVKHDIIDS